MPLHVPLNKIPQVFLFHIFRKLSLVSFFRLYRTNNACKNFIETSHKQNFIYCYKLAVKLSVEQSNSRMLLEICRSSRPAKVFLNITSLAEDFRNAGLQFLSFYSVQPWIIKNEHRGIFSKFIHEVNLQCTYMNYTYPEWIECCKPKRVHISEDINDGNYDSLRRANFIESSRSDLKSLCDNVVSHVPQVLATVDERTLLEPFFNLLRRFSADLSVNKEMILVRNISSYKPWPAFPQRNSSSERLQMMLKLDDLFKLCPELRDYKMDQMGDISIMHKPVKGKATFIVMYVHDESFYNDIIAYKITNSFEEFFEFYIRFCRKVNYDSSIELLLPTDEWKLTFGLH